MVIIVGLGNPGEKYEATRHNVGFHVVDKLARDIGNASISFSKNSKLFSLIAVVKDIYLVKPQLFMNDSGKAVKAVIDYYKYKPEDLWLVHDDIDLPMGKIRIRTKGSSGGHRGVISIMEQIKNESFVRFRLGIGRGHESEAPPGEERKIDRRNIIHHVLSNFRRSEAGTYKHLLEKGSSAVRLALDKGIEVAMNRYNKAS